MIFTLEALKAKYGDCLLLHYGPRDAPRTILIDGGPGGVYRSAFRPRLEKLRQERGLAEDDALEIPLLMVSHIDDDHINGVLDLTEDLIEKDADGRPLPYRIETLWHNSFDDIAGNSSDQLFQAAAAALGAGGAVGPASVGGAVAGTVGGAGRRLEHPGQAIAASVLQGRELRNAAQRLGIPVNVPFEGLILAPGPDDDAAQGSLDLDHGLTFRILGPPRDRVRKLQKEWDDYLEEKGLAAATAEAVGFVDNSVFNLASIVVLAEMEDRRILLTGDARGDDILQGLRDAGLLDDGTFHVDVLKLPHHGSDRNVETDFFRTVTADHYVISGNGHHGNPEVATFEMLFAARENADFTLHLTYPPEQMIGDYPVDRLNKVLDEAMSERPGVELRTAEGATDSLRMELLEA